MSAKKDNKKKKNPLLDVPIMQHVESEDPQRPYPSLEDLGITSSNDCTGLIPSMPQSEAEIENYKNMFHLEP